MQHFFFYKSITNSTSINKFLHSPISINLISTQTLFLQIIFLKKPNYLEAILPWRWPDRRDGWRLGRTRSKLRPARVELARGQAPGQRGRASPGRQEVGQAMPPCEATGLGASTRVAAICGRWQGSESAGLCGHWGGGAAGICEAVGIMDL
jgi:hypothetical protein